MFQRTGIREVLVAFKENAAELKDHSAVDFDDLA